VTPSSRSLVLPAAALATAVLALSGCGGSSSSGGGGDKAADGGTVAAQGPADAQTATVTGTQQQMFSPSTITAKTGTLTLTLVRAGGVPHNLTFSDPSVGAPIPVSGPGTGTYRFAKPGTYTFVCTIHEGMTGKVVVS
jgi:plastocyanin